METTTRSTATARRAMSLAAAVILALSIISSLVAVAPPADAWPLGGSTQVLAGPCLGSAQWTQTAGPAAHIHDRNDASTLVDLTFPGMYTFDLQCNGTPAATVTLYETGWSFDVDERVKNPPFPIPCENCDLVFFDPQGFLVDPIAQFGQPVEWDELVGLGGGLTFEDNIDIDFDAIAELGQEGLIASAVLSFDAERLIHFSMAVITH